jgi:hypothetical protein
MAACYAHLNRWCVTLFEKKPNACDAKSIIGSLAVLVAAPEDDELEVEVEELADDLSAANNGFDAHEAPAAVL